VAKSSTWLVFHLQTRSSPSTKT